ncbi:MAG TPA: PD-(D/E)XK nuclease family protein [Candidatus Saccharicenans sp.]|jgi:putative RecB family exonuclease|nr:PD-(D/E)XK nuclease family protein [Candidatus Saccharicenans sp.]HRD02178.1 PD-(D/E)XK nuclease family protein [Candidatus Saccharicenans sp.]
MVYSHSKLETYQNCPRKYKLCYLDDLRPEEEGIEAFLGSRFHEAMEELYSELYFRLMSLEEVKACYDSAWKKKFHDKVKIVEQGRTAEDYFRLGLKFIEDYYKHYYPFNQNRILGLEQALEIDLYGDRRYLLRGFADRIDLAPDGLIEIHDYKTASQLPPQMAVEADRQLALYQLGIKQKWPWAEKFRLVWHYVAFDQELYSTRTPEQLDQLRKEIATLIDRIEAEQEFPPQESGLCRWCAYWDYCPLKKHEVALEKLSPSEYGQEEGVVLVNSYVTYWEQKKQAEAELEKLKEALVQYADRYQVDRINGSEYYLTIVRKEIVRFPAKGQAERQKLENILREAGLWPALASLDLNSLEKAILEETLSPEVLEKLKDLISKEKMVTLRASKKAESKDQTKT